MARWLVDARLEGGDASAAQRKEEGKGLYEILVVRPQSREFIEWGSLARNSPVWKTCLSQALEKLVLQE